jgi:hypothetical protein
MKIILKKSLNNLEQTTALKKRGVEKRFWKSVPFFFSCATGISGISLDTFYRKKDR